MLFEPLPILPDQKKNSPGADFTKELKSRFRLKFKTLALNFVNSLSLGGSGLVTTYFVSTTYFVLLDLFRINF